MATHLLRDTDAVLGRALRMAVLEQQRGDAGAAQRAAAAGRRGHRGADPGGRRHPAPAAPGRRRGHRRRSASDRRDEPARAAGAGAEPAAEAAEAGRAHARQRADRDRDRSARRCRWSRCGCGCRSAEADLARAAVLSQTLFSGTAHDVHRGHRRRAADGRRRRCPPALDPDRLLITGNGLVAGLDRLLEHPGRRARPAPPTRTTRSPPSGTGWSTGSRWRRASPPTWPGSRCCERMYGEHPYAVQTPDAGAGARGPPGGSCAPCTPSGCTRPARRWCWSATSSPEQALDAAERALGGWNGGGATVDLPPTPPLRARAAAAGRPARRRCSRRCGWRCRRCRAPTPTTPPLQLANLVFGGYFSSRWVENIREDKGYTYGPHSLIEHSVAGSVAGRRGRGGHRGDRRRRCWRRCTSWAGWPRLPPERGRAGAGPAVRPRHAAARHVHPGRAGRPGQHVRRLRAAPGLPGRARRAAGRGHPRRRGRRRPRRTWRRPRRSRWCSATPTRVEDAAGGAASRWSGCPWTSDRLTMSEADLDARRGRPRRRWRGPRWTGPRTAATTRRGWPRRGRGRGCCWSTRPTARRWSARVRRRRARSRCCRPGRRPDGERDVPRCGAGRGAVLRGRRAAAGGRGHVPAVNLRDVGHLLDDRDAGLFTTAVALANWHARHRVLAGHRAADHGPRRRLVPGGRGRRAALAAYRPGHDRAGPRRRRRARTGAACWATTRPGRGRPGVPRFSCLAGFVEPGESAEAAVVREVAEEVGIAVDAHRLRRQPVLAVPGFADARLPRARRPDASRCGSTRPRSPTRAGSPGRDARQSCGGAAIDAGRRAGGPACRCASRSRFT